MHEHNDTRTTQRSSLLRHLNGHDFPKYRHEHREPGQSMTRSSPITRLTKSQDRPTLSLGVSSLSG